MAAKTTRRSSGTIHFAPEVTFAGNTATISSTDLSIGDSLLTLNKGNSSLPASSGIELEEASSIVASLKYTEASGNGTWTFLGKGSAVIDFNNATFDKFALGLISSVDINGGTIDGATIGAATPSTGVFTNLTASGTVSLGAGSVSATTFTGALAGDVTGDLTGDVTGNTTGNVTGNLIGDVYASNTTTKILEAGTNGTDSTILATLTGDSTGVHTGNVKNGSGTVIVDTSTNPATITGQISNIANHSTTNLSEGTNLYYTDARADARITAASINAVSDVNITAVANNNILQYNSGTSKWENKNIGYAVANWQTATHTTNNTINGTSLAAGAASGLSDSIIVASPTQVRIQSQIRYEVTHTGGAYTEFYAQLFRTSGTKTLLAEDKNKILQTDGAIILNSNFDVFENVVAGTHTYAVEFYTNNNTCTLDTNPAPSTGTATSYIQLTEIIVQSDIMTAVQQDTGPVLGGQLNANNNSIINLAAPSNQTDAATKKYVDDTHATANELSELTDVTITGTPANNSIIKYDTTTSKWIVGTDIDTTTDVVDDTTPQLGGDLYLNGNNITGTGSINITGGITASTTGAFKDGTYSGNVTIDGNLTVSGDTTTIDVENMTVEDSVILMNKNTQAASNTDSGIMVDRGTATNNAVWFWDHGTSKWIAATTTSSGTSTNITVTATADIQAAVVQTNNILPNTDATYDIGSSSLKYNMVYATSTSAQYADLAELYTSDQEYPAGTVVVHGGEKEVTQSTTKMDHKVAGVVSSNPAYLMNSEEKGMTVPVALRGKAPVSVIGPVAKGDLIVTSETPGVGEAHPGVTNCVFVIGKALEDDDTENLVRLINVLI
jgi:hypothetical protein